MRREDNPYRSASSDRERVGVTGLDGVYPPPTFCPAYPPARVMTLLTYL
ncbi:hypothetical protein JOF35_003824 [Streptomyces demainii]|uniref:Uncharacterized protein n=1 Tax=Streptomyces demainii TaxID=588122 RepID=A0ABT9KSZ9_9ACTN|nr:hypothetical protein [Streptomyces demainii]